MGNCIGATKSKIEETETKVEHNTEAKIEHNTETKIEPKIQTKVKPKVITEEKFEKDENYEIPQFKKKLQEARILLENGDKEFYYPFLKFLEGWINQKFETSGLSLYQVEEIVERDVKKALKNYPVHSTGNLLESKLIPNIKKAEPDLISDIAVQTQENITDRAYQLSFRSEELRDQFHADLIKVFVTEAGALEIKTGTKVSAKNTKSLLRFCTKVLQQFIDPVLKSRQVYTDLNHHYWAPVGKFLVKIIKQNLGKIKCHIYDLLRGKAIFRNVQEVERAYQIFYKKYEKDIFRVKNRLSNPLTGDVLINMMYKGLAVQIQIAIQCDDKKQMFHHKLYELSRQKLGMAFVCFTFLLYAGDYRGQKFGEKETKLGWIKVLPLRQKIPEGYDRLTVEEAQTIAKDIQSFLQAWSTIALKTGGKLQGYCYGPPISKGFYCLQCGQMMLIKRKNKI